MLKISKQTKLTPEKILKQSSEFFGKDGLGLEEKERNLCCIYFEGGGGYVSIKILDEETKREVEIESKEWDYHARRFLEVL